MRFGCVTELYFVFDLDQSATSGSRLCCQSGNDSSRELPTLVHMKPTFRPASWWGVFLPQLIRTRNKSRLWVLNVGPVTRAVIEWPV